MGRFFTVVLIIIVAIFKCEGFVFNLKRGNLKASQNVLKSSAVDSRIETRMQKVFKSDKDGAKLVAYLTAGYPHPSETLDLLLAIQAGGADIIEIGVPFTDPQADGATIQRANEIALSHNVNLQFCLDTVRAARDRGLQVPVVLMGYYNSFLSYGESVPDNNHAKVNALMAASKQAGVDGFIVVDLPPEEGQQFIKSAQQQDLSFVPLVSPTTTNERIRYLSANANEDENSFIYIVSIAGITGARSSLPGDLSSFIERVRTQTNKPIAVGFGISTPQHVEEVSQLGDGVVVGSAIINNLESNAQKSAAERAQALQEFIATLSAATKSPKRRSQQPNTSAAVPAPHTQTKPLEGRQFGEFGGRYIAETLEVAHNELADAYAAAIEDPSFLEELAFYRREFVGGPTPLYFAENLSKQVGGANIYFKREELAHTGAHKINNALGQVLLAKRLGKTRIIAETGAGQHGVATAAVCAKFNLPCTIYMGAKDCERQKLNVFRMQTLGAKVVPVEAGSRTLKDAINEAMRDWVSNIYDTHYLIGSAIGAHPFPRIVRDFQAIIGREAREQMLARIQKLPDAVVACVGGGSNAIGIFHPFVGDEQVQLFGAEAGGDVSTVGSTTDTEAVLRGDGGVLTSATLSFGSPGVLHGTKTYLLQDTQGNILKTRSISAGLDYPGVGPEHAFLKDSGRAVYKAVSDAQALEAFLQVSRLEGIIPALEPAHALYLGMQVARELGKGKDVLINISGRGDKDMITVAKHLGIDIN